MKKSSLLALVVSVILIASSISVIADNTYVGYSTTVGSFNGSGYTGYDHVKSTTGAAGKVDSYTVGGDYVVDVRMLDSDGNPGNWLRDLNDGEERDIDGDSLHAVDDSMRLQFSNDINTPVNVQVEGQWKSDQ